MGELRRIGFSLNPDNDAARETLTRAESWCSGHGVEAWSSPADDAEQIRAALQNGTVQPNLPSGKATAPPADELSSTPALI